MKQLKQLAYIMFHPVIGFEEMKTQREGSLLLSLLIGLIFFIASAIERQFTNFRFNNSDTESINIIYIFIATFIVYLCFVLANWSITALFDGEGSFREILLCCGYSLAPYSISLLVGSFLSHYLTLNESSIIGLISSLGILWSATMLILGMIQIHAYSLVKTILSLIGSIIGLLLVLFLSFLLMLLFQQFYSFIFSIYEELMMVVNL